MRTLAYESFWEAPAEPITKNKKKRNKKKNKKKAKDEAVVEPEEVKAEEAPVKRFEIIRSTAPVTKDNKQKGKQTEKQSNTLKEPKISKPAETPRPKPVKAPEP